MGGWWWDGLVVFGRRGRGGDGMRPAGLSGDNVQYGDIFKVTFFLPLTLLPSAIFTLWTILRIFCRGYYGFGSSGGGGVGGSMTIAAAASVHELHHSLLHR